MRAERAKTKSHGGAKDNSPGQARHERRPGYTDRKIYPLSSQEERGRGEEGFGTASRRTIRLQARPRLRLGWQSMIIASACLSRAVSQKYDCIALCIL